MISDAASPVHIAKINNVVRRKDNSINANPKKRRIIHQQKEEEKQKGEGEEEDTASSPLIKPRVLVCWMVRSIMQNMGNPWTMFHPRREDA
ncbi:Vascular-related unknown protein 2 [Hirschfeldia incana]|nr:Vascular-related unknown protein 2 [Hirschfeldia incana]